MSTDLDVKLLREELGQTQSAFACGLGVDQATVSNWENGKTSPRGPALRLLQLLKQEAQSRQSAEVGS